MRSESSRKKKREFWEAKLENMENQMITRNIRNFYQEVKKSKVDGNKKAVFYRTRDGELIGDIDRKLNR
nr:unnamed protein product [Callosobruchus chinensis]